MKKSLSIILFMSAVLSMTACSNANNPQQQAVIHHSDEEIKEAIADQTTNSPEEQGRGRGIIEENFSVSVYGKIPQYITLSNAKEGKYVKKGDLLFQLNTEDIENEISKLDATLAERELALREILIGQGYAIEDKARIPQKKLEFAKIKSGYNTVLTSKQIALQLLNKTKIYAPASGFIEHLIVNQYDIINPSVACCKIVNTEELKVVFYVLETELKRIKVGKTIHVAPIQDAQQRYEATIYRIIPRVNSEGMIKVKAKLKEKNDLLPGMNVFIDL